MLLRNFLPDFGHSCLEQCEISYFSFLFLGDEAMMMLFHERRLSGLLCKESLNELNLSIESLDATDFILILSELIDILG